MKILRLLVPVFLALFLGAPFAKAEQVSHIGLNQKVLVVCVKFSDVATTRLSAQEWVDRLNEQVNAFMLAATHGKTSFRFERPTGSGVPADGWLPLTLPSDRWPGTLIGGRMAVKLADPFVDMSHYNRLLVITNYQDDTGNPAFGGTCVGWNWVPVSEGDENYSRIGGVVRRCRAMCMVSGNEWRETVNGVRDAGVATFAHEMGHQLGLPTHYGNITLCRFGSCGRGGFRVAHPLWKHYPA